MQRGRQGMNEDDAVDSTILLIIILLLSCSLCYSQYSESVVSIGVICEVTVS